MNSKGDQIESKPKAVPKAIRQLIVTNKRSASEVADFLDGSVSERTVYRWRKRFREEGHYETKYKGGSGRKVLTSDEIVQVKKQNDLLERSKGLRQKNCRKRCVSGDITSHLPSDANDE